MSLTIANVVRKSFTTQDGTVINGYNLPGGAWVTSNQEPEEFIKNLEKYGIAPSTSGKGFVLNMGVDLKATLEAGVKIHEKKSTTDVKTQLSALKVENGVFVM